MVFDLIVDTILRQDLLARFEVIRMQETSMESYELETVLKKIVNAYPPAYKAICGSFTDWFTDDGDVLLLHLLVMVTGPVHANYEAGEFDHMEELFQVIEEFVASPSEHLAIAATTGFLEALTNQQDPEELKTYANMMGSEAKAYCKAWEERNGSANAKLFS